VKIILIIIFIVFLPFSTGAAPKRTPAQIISKVNTNFSKIKDATADVTLDYNLYLFGCAGRRRMTGQAYFKAPNKIKTTINDVTYFAQGNRIRKIDQKGKKFYVRLINALDASLGFNPGLIPYNFHLKIIKDNDQEIIIEGIPKPGILKNAKSATFHIDPQKYLLRHIDIAFTNIFLSGRTTIDYKQIKGIWVPIGCRGRSALETKNNALVGIGYELKLKNLKINAGLADQLFNPGF